MKFRYNKDDLVGLSEDLWQGQPGFALYLKLKEDFPILNSYVEDRFANHIALSLSDKQMRTAFYISPMTLDLNFVVSYGYNLLLSLDEIIIGKHETKTWADVSNLSQTHYFCALKNETFETNYDEIYKNAKLTIEFDKKFLIIKNLLNFNYSVSDNPRDFIILDRNTLEIMK